MEKRYDFYAMLDRAKDNGASMQDYMTALEPPNWFEPALVSSFVAVPAACARQYAAAGSVGAAAACAFAAAAVAALAAALWRDYASLRREWAEAVRRCREAAGG